MIMKKLLLTLTVLILAVTTIFTQAPQAFKYLAIARDEAGNILINNSIGLRISMVKGNIKANCMLNSSKRTLIPSASPAFQSLCMTSGSIRYETLH